MRVSRTVLGMYGGALACADCGAWGSRPAEHSLAIAILGPVSWMLKRLHAVSPGALDPSLHALPR